MSRFTMTLTAAAVSAVAAIAAVALPAVGADSKTPRRQAEPGAASFGAFVSCLRSHGLTDAPDDPVALKPWLAAREAADPGSVQPAMAACDAKRTEVAGGPGIEKVIACVRAHGLDAPDEPDAFKRWLGNAAGSTAVDAVLRDCKMSLAPEPSEGKPGACVGDARPADKGAKPDVAKPDAEQQGDAEPGI